MFNLVAFAWIFFRAKSLSAVQSFVKFLFLNFTYRGPLIVGLNHYESFIALGAIIITVIAEVFQEIKCSKVREPDVLDGSGGWSIMH